MEIDELAAWHREQAKKMRGSIRVRDLDNTKREQVKFHVAAAELVESFSSKYQERRLADTHRDVLSRAIESFESTSKLLLLDAKGLKKMLSSVESEEDGD